MKQFLRGVRAWALRPSTNALETLAGQCKQLSTENKTIKSDLASIRGMLSELLIGAARPTLDEIELFLSERQLDMESTLERIASEKLSFSRFGDGELKLMLRPSYNLRFQPYSPQLSRDLRSLFSGATSSPTLLLGFPNLYRDLHWSRVWLDIWPEVRQLLSVTRTWGNSHVSRPICFQQLDKKGVELWRNVWDSRDVVVVTGRNSRMNMKPELFNNICSAEFVDAEPVNAYASLERVHASLKEQAGQGKLYLIALGPTGTLLSAQLAAQGEQAIDIGHITDSYETVFEGGAWPESKPVERSE